MGFSKELQLERQRVTEEESRCKPLDYTHTHTYIQTRTYTHMQIFNEVRRVILGRTTIDVSCINAGIEDT